MYKDIISYKLADHVDKNQLLKIASRIHDEWMRYQDGFIHWEIHHEVDRSFIDIVTWKDRESAKKAESKMTEISNAGEWFGCYEEGSIKSNNVQRIFSTT